MADRNFVMSDGNEAAAHVAHLCCEVMAIYPITPSSTMGEWADEWAAQGKKNIFGVVPHVIEMQSEAGAAGAVHGSLAAGALTCTFTASQGLLLMIPNMFKIAGELTPTVFHVSARTVAAHALSIFGDHSDVMACRMCGWAMLAGCNVQEAQDMAMIAHSATLKSRVPFLHFFDGFRISHEINSMEKITEDQVKAMIPMDLVNAHRQRSMNPNNPTVRGTAQNPDVFFQGREGCNKYYDAVPEIVQETMDKFAEVTGRKYNLFDYVGCPDAENLVVCMGSGCGIFEEAIERLVKEGEKIGMVKVHLFRPFCGKALSDAIPASVKQIAVMDRTKEAGSVGEPLYQDVVTALVEAKRTDIKIVGGRYGLSSKDFTPAQAKAVFDALKAGNLCRCKKFTIGIEDDVTGLSLPYDPTWSTEADDVTRALFYGLGSDGTVGANKNSAKIVGNYTNLYSQGYFEYDSKKAGSVTKSHLRFSPRPIKGSYFVSSATFIGCHQWQFVEQVDMLCKLQEGGTFLLNSQYGPDEVWDHLPVQVQEDLINKKAKFYVIDAAKVGIATGMGSRVNTILQTCFFALAKVGGMSADESIGHIKDSIQKTYGKKGPAVVEKNFKAVDGALAALFEVKVPAAATSKIVRNADFPAEAPEFVRNVLGVINKGEGDKLPVSAMPADGVFPTATTQYEKRSIAHDIPIWDPNTCAQCGFCSLVCPHAAIRMKVYDADKLAGAPEGFKSADAKGKEYAGMKATVQVFPEDCTGCGLCVGFCPAAAKGALTMKNKLENIEVEKPNCEFFFNQIPDIDRGKVNGDTVKGSQLLRPLFEFSGCCAGCGETQYVKLVTQFFGDRLMVANATGCSSIYGGNLPTTPYAKNENGQGPAWANSLFEDNAEFGLGIRSACDQQMEYAQFLLKNGADKLGEELVNAILNNPQRTEDEIAAQRKLVAELKSKLTGVDCSCAQALLNVADNLIRRSVWCFGGDGWAYDIGYGGLDHVLASGKDVNIMVLDTEVYSNTGGQASKSTPVGAVAKFAAAGKKSGKKDLGMMISSYGNVFVAQISIGANPAHAIKMIRAAEAYEGPSLIICYSHCINHGINMIEGLNLQKEAVKCGYWPLYHFDPRDGGSAFHLDSKAPEGEYKDFAMKQNRFAVLARSKPEASEEFMKEAAEGIVNRFNYYDQLQKVNRVEE